MSVRSLLAATCILSIVLVAGCSGKKKSGPACPDPGNGPTMHSGEIVGAETWAADDSPHVVTGTLNVRDGATLTIEPCAEVLLDAGVGINVAYPLTPNTGTLIAEGTERKPIRFAGNEGARWAHVYVNTPGTARFAYVTFENGGADAFEANATLVAAGDGTTPTARDLFVDHVTITGSLGAGVLLANVAGFAPGSTQLTVTGSGNTEHPYPLEIGEHSMDSIPDGSYTGNSQDEILVVPTGANSQLGLQESGTLRDRGVPYHVGTPTDAVGSSLRIGAGNGEPLTVLTIEGGVVLKFEPAKNYALQVEAFTGDFPASGEIHALGTEERPIVFTSAAATPAPGDWMGLWFGGQPQSGNQLDYVRIEYAGAECGCVLNGCSAETEDEAAIIIHNQPPSSFLTSSTISNSAGHGITRAWRGASIDFASTNTFVDNAGCNQTLNEAADGSCPDPLPSCL